MPLRPAAFVWLLGLTQIVGYGTLYYSFAILAPDMAAAFRWPVSRVFGAFSLALLAGGAAAPFAGRLMDRHGAPRVMAAGSGLCGLLLAATAAAPGPLAFAAALVLLQAASVLVLYDAAFTALVQRLPAEARPRITQLTLLAGFASSLFWPLTTVLHQAMDWRAVLLVFAGLNLLVALPVHGLLAVARVDRAAPAGDVSPAGGGSISAADGGEGAGGPAGPGGGMTAAGGSEGAAAGRAAEIAAGIAAERAQGPAPAPAFASRAAEARVFALMTAGFGLSGFLLSALLAQMVPVLTALGLGASALAVSALFGPAQVAVRFATTLFGRRRHPLVVTVLGLSMLPLAVAVLALTAPSVAGATVFVVLFGFGSGLKSIVQGTLPLALFGPGAYGTRLGRMALVRQVLAAVAPFLFALHLEAAGPGAALAAAAAAGVAGVAAFALVARLARPAAGPGAGSGAVDSPAPLC